MAAKFFAIVGTILFLSWQIDGGNKEDSDNQQCTKDGEDCRARGNHQDAVKHRYSRG